MTFPPPRVIDANGDGQVTLVSWHTFPSPQKVAFWKGDGTPEIQAVGREMGPRKFQGNRGW